MKFLVNTAFKKTDIKPCKKAQPTIIEELRNGKKENVLKWNVDIKTAEHIIELLNEVKKPIIFYQDKSIVIGDN